MPRPFGRRLGGRPTRPAICPRLTPLGKLLITTASHPERPGKDFSHMTEEWASAPQEIWKSLRDSDSLGYSENFGGFHIAARYEDVCAITRDPEDFSNFPGSAIPHLEMPPMPPVHFDPPEHTKYRQVMNPHFAPSQVTPLEPWVREKLDTIVAPLLEGDRFDVVKDIAQELTTAVTLRFMAIDEAPAEIHKWVDDLLYKNEDTPASSQALVGFLAGELQKRRDNPGDDLLSAMVTATPDGTPMSDGELLGMSVVIVSAGLETTNSAIGGGTLYFLEHPEARQELLNADEKTWRLAMDEVVRWTSPASANARHVVKDAEVHGCPMTSGDRVLVMWGAANHDEREFPDPESLVLDRFPNRHVGFGMGPHRCVGLHLAKLMMTAYFQRILPELAKWQLDGDQAVTWGGAETRGVRSVRLARR